MKKSKLLTTCVALSLFIVATCVSFVGAAKPELLKNYKAYHDRVYAQKIKSEKYSDSDRKIVEKFLKTAIDECDFSMNVPVTAIKKIIEEDKIKSRVELEWNHFENAKYDEKYLSRRWSTPEFFHVSANVLRGEDYEKYGYLSCKDKKNEDFICGAMYISQFYGNFILNFKKDRLIDRTTLTIGDSLDNRRVLGKNTITPTMACDPKIVCVPGYSKDLVSLLANSINECKLLPQYPNLVKEIRHAKLDLDYFELQFHGDLSFKNDVESVDIIRTNKQNESEKEEQERIADKIRELGITTNIIDCSK